MIGMILMGAVFTCSLLGCVILYGIATAEAEPTNDNLLSGCIFMVLLFKPEIEE